VSELLLEISAKKDQQSNALSPLSTAGSDWPSLVKCFNIQEERVKKACPVFQFLYRINWFCT